MGTRHCQVHLENTNVINVVSDVRTDAIEAFIECVSEVGIEKATYRAVAARARVGLGTVQHYFSSKSAMINEALLVQHRALRKRHETTDAVAPPENVTEAIKQRFARTLHRTDDERSMFSFYLEYWAHASRDPELRLFHHELWEQFEADVTAELVASFIDNGREAPPHLADIAATLIALIYGLNTNVALHPRQYPSSRVLRILETVTDALLGESREPVPGTA